MKTTIILIAICSIVNGARVPEFLKFCARNDPNVNSCLKRNIQTAIENLGNGIPEFGLYPLDPYSKKFVQLEYTNGRFVGRADIEKLQSFGLGKGIVHDVRTNFQDNFVDIDIDMSAEKANIIGYLHGEVGFETILLKTQSSFNITLTGLKWTWKIHAEPKLVGDKIHLKVLKFGMRPEISYMRILLPEVFSDNPILSRFAQTLVLAYWDVIYREALPEVANRWDKTGSKVCNRIFKNIPYDEIFPLN